MTPSSVPAALWLVRHGESAANIARNAAYEADLEDVAVTERDPDVPLSPLGVHQATALGRWFASRPAAERPTVVLSSTYERARRTADLVVNAGVVGDGVRATPVLVDERWREKELGLFYRITHHGVARRYPEQWALREELGLFYYRPPNGESAADVVLRVRAALDDVARTYAGERVLVVCHQITILCVRYVLERMSETALETAWRAYDLANCSVTEYRPDAAGRLAPGRVNFTIPVEDGAGSDAGEDGAPVTAEPPAGTLA